MQHATAAQPGGQPSTTQTALSSPHTLVSGVVAVPRGPGSVSREAPPRPPAHSSSMQTHKHSLHRTRTRGASLTDASQQSRPPLCPTCSTPCSSPQQHNQHPTQRAHRPSRRPHSVVLHRPLCTKCRPGLLPRGAAVCCCCCLLVASLRYRMPSSSSSSTSTRPQSNHGEYDAKRGALCMSRLQAARCLAYIAHRPVCVCPCPRPACLCPL